MGRFKGNTTYTIQVKNLTDVFGQNLKRPFKTRIKVEPSQPHLSVQGRNMVVLDPNSGGRFSVFSTNMDTN